MESTSVMQQRLSTQSNNQVWRTCTRLNDTLVKLKVLRDKAAYDGLPVEVAELNDRIDTVEQRFECAVSVYNDRFED